MKSQVVAGYGTGCAAVRGLLAVAALLTAAQAAADQVQIGPIKDATLIQSATGSLANGGGDYLHCGRTNQNPAGAATISLRRPVIQFDVSCAVPPGSTITSASLRMNMSRTKSNTARSIALRRVLTAWNEGTANDADNEGSGTNATPGDVTWLHTFYNTTNWTTIGGDFSGVSDASTNVGAIGVYTWSSAGMATAVQGWLNTPATNNGWLMLGVENITATAKRFDSRTHPVAANRPLLTINYTPPADAASPTVSITSPTSLPTYVSATATIDLAGPSGDDIGVTQVSWLNSLGGSGNGVVTKICYNNTPWTITGIPLQIGTNVLTVTARDAVNNMTNAVLSVDYNPGSPPVIDPIADQNGSCGVSFASIVPSASGTPPITWTLMSGPGGMTINGGTGQVMWPSPVAAVAPYNITVKAMNGLGSDTKNWQLKVRPGDFNGDGTLNAVDVGPFVDHLLLQAFDHPCAADVNLDTQIDGDDIPAFTSGL